MFKRGYDGLVVSQLKYVDDIVSLGEASVENRWTIKFFLISFELVSSLRMRFFFKIVFLV